MSLFKYLPYKTFLLCIALSACSEEEQQSGPSRGASALSVDAYVAQPETFDNKIITTANLMPAEQVELRAPISGQVLAIRFREGERVKKGEAIVRLDDRSWHAQLSGLNSQLETARKDLERKKALIDAGGSSKMEVEQAETTVQDLTSRVRQLQINIDLANVDAPFAGQLGMRNFSEGAYLQQGDLITTLTQTDRVKVDFTLASQYHGSLKEGRSIDVLLDGDTLSATIYAISPVIDQESRTINVRAMLDVPKERQIIPGAFAEVIVSTNFSDAALLVPTQAIVPEINDLTLYVVEKGKAVKKVVQTGNRNAEKVHVMRGIQPGDTIVTSGLLQIRNGMSVNIQSLTP